MFAALDRPTVVYSRGNKLHYANVNTKEVRRPQTNHSQASHYGPSVRVDVGGISPDTEGGCD